MSNKPQKFPKWMNGPDGQGAVFERAEDIPEGWVEHPLVPEVQNEETGTNPETNTDSQTDTTEGQVDTGEPEGTETDEVTEEGGKKSNPREELIKSLNEQKVPELRAMAEEIDIPSEGTKPELIERIANRLEALQASADESEPVQ